MLSAIFITFSGNCRNALSFYQSCFGGLLQFESFEMELAGRVESPVVSGSLISDKIVIHGSDLVHSEGRQLGNYMAIFLVCKSIADRKELVAKLALNKSSAFVQNEDGQKLMEVTDAFDVRWVLAV
jgi:PhnB protein